MKIVISYRHEDSSGHAGRLRDWLAVEFGARAVFFDHESIKVGEDFADQIGRAIASSDIVLAVIGPQWRAHRPEGSPRLSDRTDSVRQEIVTALELKRHLVPVLVKGAAPPRPDELPKELRAVAWLKAHRLNDNNWCSDVKLLSRQLWEYKYGDGVVSQFRYRLHRKRRDAIVVMTTLGVMTTMVILMYFMSLVYFIAHPGAPPSSGDYRAVVERQFKEVEKIKPDRITPVSVGFGERTVVNPSQPKETPWAILIVNGQSVVGGVSFKYNAPLSPQRIQSRSYVIQLQS